MPEYIEREEVINAIDTLIRKENQQNNCNSANYALSFAKAVIEANIPAADVVEVVRCKDCEYWRKFDSGKVGMCRESHIQQKRKANDFCSYGKRRVDVDDG